MPSLGKRPLALLSEGRLSESQIRALTLLSLGWIEVIYVPEPEEDDGRRTLGVVYMGAERNYKQEKFKALKEEDDVIFAIISTFVQWQESKVA